MQIQLPSSLVADNVISPAEGKVILSGQEYRHLELLQLLLFAKPDITRHGERQDHTTENQGEKNRLTETQR